MPDDPNDANTTPDNDFDYDRFEEFVTAKNVPQPGSAESSKLDPAWIRDAFRGRVINSLDHPALADRKASELAAANGLRKSDDGEDD